MAGILPPWLVFDKSSTPRLVFFYQLNRQSIRDEAGKNMTGSSGHRRVPISFYENLKISVPSIDIQQKIVQEIEVIEAQISTAEHSIAQAPAQKQAVLKKWLE